MLLDRRRALSFASGYVEVDVRSVASPCEEAAVGRVLVHHSIDFEAPSPTSRLVLVFNQFFHQSNRGAIGKGMAVLSRLKHNIVEPFLVE